MYGESNFSNLNVKWITNRFRYLMRQVTFFVEYMMNVTCQLSICSIIISEFIVNLSKNPAKKLRNSITDRSITCKIQNQNYQM